MRIEIEDHARFQRGALVAAVACSAAACGAVLVGSERFPATAPVLAAAVATLALALAHARLVRDAVAGAVARAAAEADADGRALLGRALAARDGIVRAVRAGSGGLGSGEGRAMTAAAAQAVGALVEVCRRRQRLAQRVGAAAPAEAARHIEALALRAEGTADAVAREAFARAAAALRERGERAASLAAVIERLDARAHAAVAELEGAALAAGTRAELGPADPPATLATACDRLRAAGADLGAECEAMVEVGNV